jgi:hypothetical protein
MSGGGRFFADQIHTVYRLLFLFTLVSAAIFAEEAAAPDPLDALVKDSPFAPVAGATRAGASGQTGPIEFRSVVFEDGEYAFSLYDQGSQQSAWLRIGETGLPFIVRSYDQERDIVTVEHQGRSLTLELQPGRMSDQPSPGTPPAPLPGPAQAGSGPPLPSAAEASGQGSMSIPAQPAPGGSNAGPNQESQRLQALADEIRRRRQSPLQSGPK